MISGNIKKQHLRKFIKHVLYKKHYGILIYEVILFFIVRKMVENSLYSNLTYEMFEHFNLYLTLYTLLWWLVIPGIVTHFMLNGFGQNLLRIVAGARKIERMEHVEKIKKPVEAIIKEATAKGMALPNDINVYVINRPEAIAYAVGMNTIVVSEGMSEQDENIFKAKILSELCRINHMDPDYLLFMLGSNVVSGIIAVCMLLFTMIDMRHGDRRANMFDSSDSKEAAGAFIVILSIAAIWIGFCFMCVRKYVRSNNFDSDLSVAKFGYGEYICVYIDKIQPEKLPARYKILELGHPSKNARIAALQKSGISYFAK